MDRENRNFFQRMFMPIFDEVSLFIMGLSFFLIFLSDEELQNSVSDLMMDGDVRAFIAGVFFFAGLALSVFHFFSLRPKSDFEKVAMLLFVVFANGSAGLVAGINGWGNSSGLISIFPAWNILMAVMLFVFWRFKVIDEDNISDENAGNLFELFVSLVAIIAIFSIGKFWLKLHWSDVYSICVVYATSINCMFSDFLITHAHDKRRNENKSDF